MKKYISWIVCAFLLISAFFLSRTSVSIAGEGDGVNQEVKTVEEVGSILKSFCGEDDTEITTKKSMGSALELANATEDEYTSATLHFNTVSRVSGYTYMKLQKQMTCYFTQDEAYYVSKGEITTENYGLLFDADVYFTGEESFVKFKQFTARINNSNRESESQEAPSLPQGVLHKWIRMDEYSASLIDVNETNYEVMAMLGGYILASETDVFKKNGDVYSLKNTETKNLCAELASISGANFGSDAFKQSSFTVDLASKTSPYISLMYDASEKFTYPTSQGSTKTYTINMFEQLTCRLSNINNTVVNFPSDVEIYEMSDFEG